MAKAQMIGPLAAFSGIMGAPVSRKCALQVMANATFTVLVFEFEAAEAGEVAATSITYPALTTLEGVKSFQLSAGAVLAAFKE